MNINENINNEYMSYYNLNKGLLNKYQKVTIYDVLELEKEQKLNEILEVEDKEKEIISVMLGIVGVSISMETLFNNLFKEYNTLTLLYVIFCSILITGYLIYSNKKRNDCIKNKNEIIQKNNVIKKEIEKISIKQAVIKRLALEEDSIKL